MIYWKTLCYVHELRFSFWFLLHWPLLHHLSISNFQALLSVYEVISCNSQMYLVGSEVKWSEVAQSCLTLCDPMDCSQPGSSVHGIFQAWILEWVAVSFSRESFQPRDWTHISRVPFIGCAMLNCSVMSDSLWPRGPTRLLCLWNSPGKNTGASCHFLLQEIFLPQESNLKFLCLLHYKQILYH